MSGSTALAMTSPLNMPEQASTRTRTRKPIEPREMDRLIRIFLLLKSRPAKTNPKPVLTGRVGPACTAEESSYIEDLAYVHAICASKFAQENEGEPFDAVKTLVQIGDHPALQPLDEIAQCAAATYVFEALLAQQLRAKAKYWVLDNVGDSYPYPLGLRAGSLLRWKKHSRALGSIYKNLESIRHQVGKLQSENVVVGNHFDDAPFGLLLEAEELIEAAITWMDNFPKPSSLRSKYREHLRPVLPGEHISALAYALNWLFHHRVREGLSEKEIENRIATLETQFLGQNIEANGETGCPAVRMQIRTIKRSSRATELEKSVAGCLKMIRKQKAELVRDSTPAKSSAQLRLMKRLLRHCENCIAFRDAIYAKLDEKLRDKVDRTEFRDEICDALTENVDQTRPYMLLSKSWSDEFEAYWNGIEAHLDDIYEYSKVVEKWMRGWEAFWSRPI